LTKLGKLTGNVSTKKVSGNKSSDVVKSSDIVLFVDA
jgi:hypothetical protein